MNEEQIHLTADVLTNGVGLITAAGYINNEGGQAIVVLPWDPEYPRIAGEACRVAAAYPDHLARQPSRRSMPLPPRKPD